VGSSRTEEVERHRQQSRSYSFGGCFCCWLWLRCEDVG
jgi:hypothetical protein